MSRFIHRRGLILGAAGGLLVPSLARAQLAIPQPRRFWSPNLIPSLVEAWYDAETQVGGDGVDLSTFKDRSGRGRDATATSGVTTKAKMRWAIINGRKTVDFNQGSNSLDQVGTSSYDIPSAVLSGATQASVMAVVQKKLDPLTAAAQAGHFISGVQSDASVTDHWPFNSDQTIYDAFGTSARKTVGNPTPALTTPRIYSAHSASGDWRAYLDGTLLFSTATNTVGVTTGGALPRNIGRSTNNTNYYSFHGYVGEIILFNDVLSTANRQLVEGYLGWKWGLQVQLPSGHPWKTSRP